MSKKLDTKWRFKPEDYVELEDIVIDTMLSDGPDGHCDGSEIITQRCIAFFKVKLEQWLKDAPVVYAAENLWNESRYLECTLKAKLVCMEALDEWSENND